MRLSPIAVFSRQLIFAKNESIGKLWRWLCPARDGSRRQWPQGLPFGGPVRWSCWKLG